jgi:hypothetical protein
MVAALLLGRKGLLLHKKLASNELGLFLLIRRVVFVIADITNHLLTLIVVVATFILLSKLSDTLALLLSAGII